MIKNFKNILSEKDFKYLIFLFFGMIIAALIEMIGLGSIPLFIMVVVDINTLIDKFPNFFAVDYMQNLSQSTLTIYSGLILIFIFFFKNLYLTFFLFCQGKIIKKIRTDINNKIFNAYINATYSFHINNNPSVLTRTIASSVAGAVSAILSTLSIIKEILVMVVIFLLLSLNEPLVSFSVFFSLVIITAIFLFFTRK